MCNDFGSDVDGVEDDHVDAPLCDGGKCVSMCLTFGDYKVVPPYSYKLVYNSVN